MKKYLAILFLLLKITCYSQQNDVKNILKEYTNCKIDTVRIDLLIKINDGLQDLNPQMAVTYAKTELAIAQNLHDSYRVVLLNLMIAESYGRLGKIAESLTNLDTAFRIATKFNFLRELGRIQLNTGIAYADVGNEQLAIQYYLSGIVYFKSLHDSMNLIQNYVDLSDAYYHKNQSDSALYYLKLAEPLSLKNKNYELSFIYTNCGEAYYVKKNYQLAYDYILKAFAIAKKINDLYVLSDCYLVLAKIDFDKGKMDSARIIATKGLEIANQSNIRENLIDGYNLMSKILEKQNNPKEALRFKNLYILIKDSVLSIINNNLSQAYEYEKQDEKLAELKTATLLQETELKKQYYITTIILVTLILVIFLSGYIYYSRYKLGKANTQIKNAYQEVRNHEREILLQNEELIKNNQQIKIQSEDIERLNKIKDRLFNIISHDLRSPLKSLTGMLKLLEIGTITPEKFQKFVPELIKGATTTSELVDNLLNWSNSQLTGSIINLSTFNVATVAQNQVHLFERQAVEKQINLCNDIANNLFVFADKDMIDLVLRNLISNAIKFCSNGGSINITGQQLTNCVEICVIDDGKGISPDNLKKIFQTQERFTTKGTNNEIGTGLGLMFCKDFIEKNNGVIGVESKLNEGSKFWFTLPIGAN